MKLLIKNLVSEGNFEVVGTGWLPPMPDLRDYAEDNLKIKPIIKKLGMGAAKVKVPASTDLRQWCSPVENQLTLGSCTAHAGIGIVEYYEKRAFNKHVDGSRLFLYKATRNLMQEKGDTGAFLRTTM